MSKTIADVACTVCGCVCDDLRVTVEGERIVAAEGACFLAESWFLRDPHQPRAACEVEGVPVEYEAAQARAVEILSQAQAPLIYGLSRSSTEGQRAAVALADQLGATIDTTASRCHAPSIMALQQVGESTCTLGEVKNRADLVIYWGSNPVESHPRHLERYAYDPRGLLIDGPADRTLVVADVCQTATSQLAQQFVPIEAGHDFEALWTLRCLVRQIEPQPDVVLGAPLAALEELAARMRSCRFGVIFFGLGLTQGPLGHHNVEALLRLVTELNAVTRFHARRMRVPGDVTGADSVLAWQTGYPFSVSLNRGYPRYNPGEFSANERLERGEVDACLLVGSEGVSGLSPRAVERLRQLPTIVLDYPAVALPWSPAVRFTTAIYGIHRPGTAYRMDEVPIPLRRVLTSPLRSDGEVLDDLLAALR